MIYLDHSATSPPNEEVIQSYVAVSTKYFANPSSLHKLGVEANELFEQATAQIKQLLSMPQGEVIYTSGGTEANNLAIIGYARKNVHLGKHIVTTTIEHPSVLEACRALEKEGFTITYLPVDEQGQVVIEQLREALTDETILVSIMHVNNEMGATQNIRALKEVIQRHSQAVFHVDAVQSFGKIDVPFGIDGADMMSISAHKINGMRGSGALFLRHRYPLEPILYGGGQQQNIRSGTIPLAEAVALAKAMRLAIRTTEREEYRQWKNQMINHVESLSEIQVVGPHDGAAHIIALAIRGIRGEVAVNFLQQRDIIVSTSSACSSLDGTLSHVAEALKIPKEWASGIIRISLGVTITEEQIEQLLHALTALNEQVK